MKEEGASLARFQRVSDEKKEQARDFRKGATPHEDFAWKALKAKRLMGLKFRRQQVFGRYVLDFYCPALRLGLEIDGAAHDDAGEYDAIRDAYMAERGIEIVRIRNDELTEEKLRAILSKIMQERETA